MASLQERNGSYRVLFCHHGKLHTFTIGKVKKGEAENKARQVDYLLMRLKQRLLVLPDGTDIVTFIEHDGKPPEAGPTLACRPASGHHRRPAARPLPLHPRQRHHRGQQPRHLQAAPRPLLPRPRRRFPARRTVAQPAAGVRQPAGRRRSCRPVTIRKEIATLRAAWNWGEPMGLTAGKFPNRGLRYPKADEKPPFMTMAEIERQIWPAVATRTLCGRRCTCKPAN